MDHDSRQLAAKRNDSELAARIVRNIEQIQDDFFHSTGPLSEKIWQDALVAVNAAAADTWQVVEVDWGVRLVCPEWKMLRGVGTGDMWLELNQLSADEDGYEYSWLAAALKAAPTQLCIAVVFRPGLRDLAAGILKDAKASAPLLKAGFVYDEAQGLLIVPINIAAEALAQGFEQNDLTAALAPIGKAMSTAMAAKGELLKLIELVRGAAKRG